MRTLLVGGYGSVGRTIAQELTTAADGPSRLEIAGRDGAKASAFAADLADDVSGVAFDIRETSSYAQVLKGVDQTVVCLDQSGTAFVEACLERGIDYVDVAASDEFFRQVEEFDGIARATGATAMLSVGLAPGVTNLLAKRAVDQLSAVSAVRIGILLGLGEAFGPAASRWTLERIGREFQTGEEHSVRGFSDPRPMKFPFYGRRTTYKFDFADQHVLRRTLDIPSATTRLCFDSRVITSAVYQLSQRGLYRPIAATVGIDPTFSTCYGFVSHFSESA
jgi:saccharopine dehydrogenase-like NADP-dependent oxidoreductase